MLSAKFTFAPPLSLDTPPMTRATVDRLNTALTGRYRVEHELGQEEMATVFLARDLTHEVQVALKVLNPELAKVVGAERFLAEIRVMANLTHAHILSLHDLGEADGFLFYVMPYMEGETLRDRIDREGQLPVDEAVGIARAVADALDHAHRYWVSHLDIKPDSILLQEGGPVVSDFGIALAVGVAGGDRLTEAGLGLGTPSYMSPEQSTGDQPVGRSTDIYALGSVLYEMLVGEPPYPGTTAQAVLGKIIASEPVSAMEKRPSVPANVDGAVRKALEKLPADRFASAKDFSSALEDEDFRHAEAAAVSGAAAGPWNRLAIAMTILSAGLVLTLAVMASALTSGPVDRATTEMVRFSVPVGLEADVYLGGDDADFGRPSRRSLAFSPNGNLLVYSAWGEDARLYLHRLDQERAEPIEGTEGAVSPFFSPDGAWIGFIAGGAAKRFSVADGRIETITQSVEIGSLFGMTWGDDGTIVGAANAGLFRFAATGGEVELLAESVASPGEILRYGQPHMLPGSKAILFHASRSYDPEQTDIVALDIATRTQKTVLPNAMDPLYLQTGHLLFVREGTLMAVAFDLERVEVSGDAVIMLEGIMHSIYMPNARDETGAAQVAVSAAGHLAYALGGVYPERLATAVRVTSTGDTVTIDLPKREYLSFRVSPDGNRLAFVARHGRNNEIWVHDLIRGGSRRLNTGAFRNWPMEWSPDSRSLASRRTGTKRAETSIV